MKASFSEISCRIGVNLEKSGAQKASFLNAYGVDDLRISLPYLREKSEQFYCK